MFIYQLRVLSDFMIAFSCPRGLDNPRERSAVYLARDVHFLGCGLLRRVFLHGLAVEMTGEFCPFDVSLLPGAFSGVDL